MDVSGIFVYLSIAYSPIVTIASPTRSPMAFFTQQNIHPHKVVYPVQFLFHICVLVWQSIYEHLENDLKR